MAQNTLVEKNKCAGAGAELSSEGTGNPRHGLNQTPFQHLGQFHGGQLFIRRSLESTEIYNQKPGLQEVGSGF